MSSSDSAYADDPRPRHQPLRTAYGQQSQQQGASNSSSQRHSPPSAMFSLIEKSKIPPDIGVCTARIQTPQKKNYTDGSCTASSTTGTGSGRNSLVAEKVQEDLDLVEFIKRHLLRGKKAFPYKIGELEQLVQMAVDSFATQETLIEALGPICVCGDIHGQYSDLMRIFTACGAPHQTRYLFLGDYVDRGGHSLEVITLLLACKIQYPNHIYLLRGNHELSHINSIYGFLEELQKRFGPIDGEMLWYRFNDVFSYMPLAATIGGKILCMHGGISPHLKSLDDIRKLKRPISKVMEPGLIQDLLWSDPSPNPNLRGYNRNLFRNCSVMFGEEALLVKLKLLSINLILRAHQVEQYGYGTFGGGKLITVFSAPRYHQEMNNWGAVAQVSTDLEVSFTLLKPPEYGQILKAQNAEEKKRRC